MTTTTTDYQESSFREKMLEYLFLTELLQEAWLKRGRTTIDVLRPDVDRAGYDLVLKSGSVTRPVQLKSSRLGATTNRQTVNVKLANEPGGCIIWLFFNEVDDGGEERIELSYLFYGGGPQDRPNLGNRSGKHVKANAQGIKTDRPNTRQINKNSFEEVKGVSQLFDKLFL